MDSKLKQKTVVVIGAGHMGGSILSGAVKAGILDTERVTAVDLDSSLLERHREALGILTSTDVAEVVPAADVIVLAVKPQIWRQVVSPFAEHLRSSQTVVSIMAGITTRELASAFGAPVPIVRSMPNLLAQVGCSASALCAGNHAGEEDMALAEELLRAVGMTVRVDEWQLDAVTGLSGSGPAFVFVLIDALADGGVRAGLQRSVALELATQTVLGAARMVQETGESPAALKERVTSPGGTTIAGIDALEKGAFRGTLMAAVKAAADRSRELGQS